MVPCPHTHNNLRELRHSPLLNTMSREVNDVVNNLSAHPISLVSELKTASKISWWTLHLVYAWFEYLIAWYAICTTDFMHPQYQPPLYWYVLISVFPDTALNNTFIIAHWLDILAGHGNLSCLEWALESGENSLLYYEVLCFLGYNVGTVL